MFTRGTVLVLGALLTVCAGSSLAATPECPSGATPRQSPAAVTVDLRPLLEADWLDRDRRYGEPPVKPPGFGCMRMKSPKGKCKVSAVERF